MLALQRRGYRRFEVAIAFLLGIILLGFLYDTLKIGFVPGEAAAGFIPSFDGGDSVLLAAGILGATVMPHVIYLHSALTQNRIRPRNDDEKRALLRFQRLDVTIAMGIAGVVNMSMLIIAASLFFESPLNGRRHDRGRLPRVRRPRRPAGGARVRARAARVGPRLVERRHLRRARS